MRPAPLPPNEGERLAELRRLDLLDTPEERAFDRVTALAAKLLDVPIALVSLVDRDRQWFKSRFGLDATETPRSIAFCSHAILGDATMIVEDATLDARFRDNPLVTGDPKIRFYAGAPLTSRNGLNLGTFCIVDSEPRRFSERENQILCELRDIITDEIWLRELVKSSEADREAARRANQLLVDMIEAAPDGFAKFDPQGRIEYCNSAYRKYFPGSEDIIRVGATLEDILRAGIAQNFFTGAGSTEEERETWLRERLRQHREQGAPFEEQIAGGRWMRISESRTADGGTVAIRADVSAQRRQAEALRRLHDATLDPDDPLDVRISKILRVGSDLLDLPIAIQSRIEDGIYTVEHVVAPEGTIERGATFDVGATYCELVVDGTGPVGFSHVGKSRISTHPCYAATGLEAYIGCPILVAGRRHGTVNFSSPAPRGAIHDDELDIVRHIALLIGAELARSDANEALMLAKRRAEEASRGKSDFLAMMSHEIRTPMNGLLGMISVLGETELDDEQQQMIGVAKTSGQNLLVIINDILDFSKLEADQLRLETGPVDLAKLAASVVDLVGPQARQKGLSIETRIHPALDGAREGDVVRLQQILLNLAGNAVKFTERGKVAIVIEPGASDDAVRFRVRDTGIGIPQESLPVLFDRFSQVDTSISRRFGGTGLGLAICKKLAGLMGGAISVDSTEGAGSTFTLDVPLPRFEGTTDALRSRAPDAPPQPPAASDGTTGTPVTRPLSVLIAEDNSVNRYLMQQALRQTGHQVDFANDGNEAIKAATSKSYDVILMDIQMPGTDGIEATRQIVARLGDRRPKIVALTAHVLHDDVRRFRDAGMDDFLSKPIDLDKLRTMLARTDGEAAPATSPGRPEGSPPPAGEILDARQIRQLEQALSPAALRRVVSSFRRDLDDRIAALRLAQADNDIEEMNRLAHALAGLAGNVGAIRVAALAREPRTAANGFSAQEASDWVDALSRAAADAVDAFSARLSDR